MNSRIYTKLGAGAAIMAISFFYFLAGITNVDPGEEAIIIKKLGDGKGMQEQTLDTGIHWWEPFTYDIDIYDIRFRQEVIDNMDAQTKDGQPISIDVSFEIGLDGPKVPELHETIGKDYYHQVVYPMARKAIRFATSTQLSDKIYQGEGRSAVQERIDQILQDDLTDRGIIINSNVRNITFVNKQFVDTLERKANATQEEIIQKRLANAAVEEANKMRNLAEGEKQKRIKAAEALREERRLEGEGERLKQEEEAKGNYAVYKAEADGRKLLVNAYGSSEAVVSVEWAKNLGPNVKVYGVPTGAPGTNSYMFDSAMRDMLKAQGAMR